MDGGAEFDNWLVGIVPALRRLAYFLTGERFEAEEVLQTALAKALVARNRVRKSGDPDAYAHRIVINVARSRWRRRRPPHLPLEDAGDHAALGDTGRVEDRWGIGRALRSLPPKQRAVVVLRYVEDLPERQVAHLLGCSVGTVKSQAAKGLTKLRAHPALDRVGCAEVSEDL